MGKILVTGGHGFVGAALVNALLDQYGEKEILYPKTNEMDLLDISQVERFFATHDIENVFHIAAKLGGVGTVTNNPLYFLETNLLLNYNLIKIALKYNIKKIITLGSSCCYNNDVSLPMKESDYWSKAPENTYGLCKLVLLEHLKAQNKTNWVYLVPPNIYGPGDHFGSLDAHLIPATFQKFEDAVQTDKKEIVVWGDGGQIRDFVYIDDLVNVLTSALLGQQYDRKIINVATGIGVSVKEIVLHIRNLMNLDTINICWDTSKPTGTIKKVLDNKLFMQFNPTCKMIEIEDGLRKTVEWYNNFIETTK